MRILLAEDDSLLGDGLKAGLRQLGFQVDWVRDGAAAERELRAQPYAAAVLDLGLPQKDGLDVLSAIRRERLSIPVLVLTARDAVPDRIRGLDLGADDYVVKPVDLHELAARLRALVRRAHGQTQEVVTVQDVVLDPAARSVRKAGEPVQLSTREFDLLHTFMLSADRVLTREQLEQHLYSWGQEVESNAVEVHIHNLRRKLGSNLIQTVRGVGYILVRNASLIESERRFTADAAHELRTPIAAIRAQAQVAMGETDDVLRRHALQNTLDGCDRAVRLVEQLLTLSRMEADAEPAMENVDLNLLAQRVVAELAPKAIEKKQVLEFSGSQHCMVRGNATLLTVLMRNLVDNAIRYSPPSAQVHVAVARHGEGFVVGVEDSGPGMTEESRRRLGERFFRVLGSGESGSGLGWSIVRRIASVHKMDLRVESSEELGGLAVRASGQAAPDANSKAS